MKLIRLFCLLLTLCCSVYAVENKQIFAGQILEDGVMKPAFLLEILDDAMVNRVAISENGEVWIKVDQLVNISTPESSNFMTQSTQNMQQRSLSEVLPRDEVDVQCSKCKHWYSPRSANGRKCPFCGKAN